ncbi:O-antigen ligase family protein [Propylenella binzhouense]|uniref:O-antigen ligase family protein n=1 Tax=Propylenella binzhouense TaxID=2555902 RepID=A0A964T9E7_9HYPH|nr:O-antigen ligase family protein [Propylenella binzhouense]MYZ49752.1 O-antigen ligase family protein [Propylenella binzhouense]
MRSDWIERAGLFIGFTLLPVVSVYATRSAATFLSVSALLLAVARMAADGSARPLLSEFGRSARRPLGLSLLAFAAVAVLSLAWSPAPLRAWDEALRLAGSIVLVLAWCVVIRRVPTERIWPYLAVGVALGAAACAYELLAPVGLRTILTRETATWNLNRPVMIVSVLASALFVISAHDRSPRRMVVSVALAALAFGVAAISESQSTDLFWLAFVPATLFAAIFARRGTIVIGVLMGVALLMIPFAVPWVADRLRPLLDAAPLANYVRESHALLRLDIWRGFAEALPARPFTGWGIASERFMKHADGSGRPLVPYAHPHSLPIQLWLDFGLVGVLVALSVLAATFRRILALPPRQGALAAGLLAALFAVWSVSHGAWQEWWLALIALSFGTLIAARAGPAPPSLR